MFKPDIKGRVPAKEVKEELIRQITTPKEEDTSEKHKSFERFMRTALGDAYEKLKRQKEHEITVTETEDVNSPLYGNSSVYKVELESGKTKKLIVHYYYTDG